MYNLILQLQSIHGQNINCGLDNYSLKNTRALMINQTLLYQYTSDNQIVEYDYYPGPKFYQLFLANGISQSMESKFPIVNDNDNFKSYKSKFLTVGMQRSWVNNTIAFHFHVYLEDVDENKLGVITSIYGNQFELYAVRVNGPIEKLIPINDPNENLYLVKFKGPDKFELHETPFLNRHITNLCFDGTTQVFVNINCEQLDTFSPYVNVAFSTETYVYFITKDLLFWIDKKKLKFNGKIPINNKSIMNSIFCYPNPNDPNQPMNIGEFIGNFKTIFITIGIALFFLLILIIWIGFKATKTAGNYFKTLTDSTQTRKRYKQRRKM